MDYPKSDPDVGLVGGKFTDGDPASAVPPSHDPASWANLVTDELLNILVAFGVTPAEANNHQLIDALLANFANIGGNASQLFRALTASQFDASTYVATTEFVKRRGFEFAGVTTIGSAQALTAAHAGRKIWLGGVGSFITTLPALSAFPDGGMLVFSSTMPGNVVQRAGTDVIYYNDESNSVTSFTLGKGDSLWLVKQDGGWIAFAGSVVLKHASVFGSSLGGAGYQKLPSGLIIQWSSSAFTPAGATFNFPITFPNSLLRLYSTAEANAGGPATNIVSISSLSLSQFVGYSSPANQNAGWIAIGY